MPRVTPVIAKASAQHRPTLLLVVIIILFNAARILYAALRAPRALLRSPAIGIILCITACLSAVASPPEQHGTLDRSEMDVIVLVWPVSRDVAHVAVAYKHKIPHDTVLRDTKKLAASIGGQISDVQIDDQSSHPDDLKKFPVNTAASFSVTGCSQISQSSPNLRAYIIGYQAWTHVEVVFAIPTIDGYSGVEQFDDPKLAVTLIKEPDAYRYEVEIREHKQDLPALPENKSATPATSDIPSHQESAAASTSPTAKPEGMSISVLSGWICGAVILAFFAMYLLRIRRIAVQTHRTGRTNL